MSSPILTTAGQKLELCQLIATQRAELDQAYHELEKPIAYLDYGIQSYNYVRRHPWIPAIGAFGSAGLIFAGLFRFSSWNRPKPSRSPSPVATPKSRSDSRENLMSKAEVATMWGLRIWKLYQLYRRIKPLFK